MSTVALLAACGEHGAGTGAGTDDGEALRTEETVVQAAAGEDAGAAGGVDTAAPDVEESRVAAARAALPEVFAGLDADLLAGIETPDAAARAGSALWRAHVGAAQRAQRSGASIDDRPLYWQRLATLRNKRADCAQHTPAFDCDAILERFEWASRGADAITWNADAPLRVLVTGFDPFFLDREIGQSNPSGLAALLLDERQLAAGPQGELKADVRSLVFPVRFADFDAGRVEALLGPLLAEVDLLITISMGRDNFDLERFPGRRRSATAPDNRNVLTGADAKNPLVPLLGGAPLPGPEFVEFSLPAAAMSAVEGPYAVRDNRTVTTLERGTFDAGGLDALQDQTAVEGGGGGYLSNEISFRTVRLARERGLPVAVGHLHTPSILGFDAEALRAITGQIERIVAAAAGAVTPSSRDR